MGRGLFVTHDAAQRHQVKKVELQHFEGAKQLDVDRR